jgi:hypothetical protein
LASPLPVDVGKNRKPIAMFGPQELRVFVEQVVPAAVEADADGDVAAVHELHPSLQFIGPATKFDAKVRVDIDNRELGPVQFMLRHSKLRSWTKVFEQQLPAIATIERSRLNLSHCRWSDATAEH